MDLSAISSAGQAFAAMRGIVETLVDVRDFTKLASVRAELTMKIIDAQSAMIDLQAKLASAMDTQSELKARIVQLESTAAERERYALYEIRSGAFVYQRRSDVQPAEPTHYLCQPCFDKGVKAVLQRSTSDTMGLTHWCPICRNAIHG